MPSPLALKVGKTRRQANEEEDDDEPQALQQGESSTSSSQKVTRDVAVQYSKKTKEEKDAGQAQKSRESMQKHINSREYLKDLEKNLLVVQCPTTRKASPLLEQHAASIQEKIAQTQTDTKMVGPISLSKVQEYLKDRLEIAVDLAEFCKTARKDMHPGALFEDTDKMTRKRMRSEIENVEDTVMRERAVILGYSAKLQLSTYYHANHVTLGEAYMYSIVESMPLPAGARLQYKSKERSPTDQTMFKKNLKAAYAPEGLEKKMAWCPVGGVVWDTAMKAAHIVPQSIGEFNAAYLFAADGLGDGYGKLWGLENGMYLCEEVEKAMDKAQVVFVRCSPDEEGEIKLLLLDQSIAGRILYPKGPKFADVDGKPLVFETDARPGLHALYIHALISVLRRRLYDVKEWQFDIAKVFTGRIWSDMDENKLKRSTVLALAAEMGDLSTDMIKKLDLQTSGVVDEWEKPIDQQDKNMAAIIRGLWMSREEAEPWHELSEEIEEEQIDNALRRQSLDDD